jgi:hypothetical protein
MWYASKIKEKTMETILIILVLLFLFGGGGFYWSRRGR